MKCNQCERPAYYEFDGGRKLCLDCYGKSTDASYKQFLMNAAMLNQAQDDMDAIVGIRVSSGRIPVNALAMALSGSRTQNHIVVSNSQIGVLNTGDLAKINAAITISVGTEIEALGGTIKEFTQEIVKSQQLSNEQKKEMGELLGALMEQLAGRRSKSIVGTLFRGIKDSVVGIVSLAELADKIFKLLSDLGMVAG